jgi:hypothetical protein
MPKDQNKSTYINLYGISEPKILPFYRRCWFILLISVIAVLLLSLIFIII